ncbi:MAG: DNA alkylation repair protein [Candidatus Nanoarchaeia archaeon]|nr:DNA alkylation repair protein [Candidatus Nanoarchaeia archaeon]MDD5357599.1 DNA alkylation repair protein [Candidatus Nanoarchaeia archaeon]MDD5588518.1 DNA alkylation repair protein [Candidatus Nanoarchaeia archaeon]
MNEIEEIKKKLREKAKPEKIPFLKMILATPFEVIGIMTPDSREIAKGYKNLNIYDMYNLFDELWDSNIHEEKSLAIHILQQYKKQFSVETWKFLKQRLDKAKTWDHIDYLATDIFGEILLNNLFLMSEIKEMANSRNFWERRLAIESTMKMIKKNKIELTLRLAENLIYDDNTYVQKGAGWMLREAGKKNRAVIKDFILMHIDMKPIAFSYATEKMTELRKIRKEKSRDDFKKEKLFEVENGN